MLCGENKGVGPSGHLIDCHESGCKKELLVLAKGHENGIIYIAENTCRVVFLSVLDLPVY